MSDTSNVYGSDLIFLINYLNLKSELSARKTLKIILEEKPDVAKIIKIHYYYFFMKIAFI